VIENYMNKVFCGDALRLLKAMPTATVDTGIMDTMYGTSKHFRYDWGIDPAQGNPVKHWAYHQPIYEECLRVLRPGGVLAWCQGWQFIKHFDQWFGDYRTWPLSVNFRCLNYCTSVWVVQTREQKAVEHPNNVLVKVDDIKAYRHLKALHPCPKSVEECAFLVKAVTQPGQIVLDCFAGLGSTLVAAEMLGRRWIGCDLSRLYCQTAMRRLAKLEKGKRMGPTVK
jgi:DNA modification methylase